MGQIRAIWVSASKNQFFCFLNNRDPLPKVRYLDIRLSAMMKKHPMKKKHITNIYSCSPRAP